VNNVVNTHRGCSYPRGLADVPVGRAHRLDGVPRFQVE
jgi:hypothetical protein